jgi:uncharacterized protein
MSSESPDPAADRYAPENLEHFFVQLLKRVPNYSTEMTPESRALQRAHLDHLWALHEQGKLVVMGPVLDDGDIRGFSIYRADSIEEVLELSSGDPGVQSGRFVLEVHPWMTHRGILP